jgi:hypothetical protein
VTVVEAAVSDQEGTLPFYEQADGSPTSSLISQWAEGGQEHAVPVLTVDGEMARLGIEMLDLLKCDVEGYDLHVLKGARGALSRSAIGVVQFEYNRPWMHAGSTLQEANRFLADHGYTMFLLNGSGLCRCAVERLGELYEYLNFVAIPAVRVEAMRLDIRPDPVWG